MDILTELGHITLRHPHMEERCFKSFVIKPFLKELLALSHTEDFKENFTLIEKKAVRKYFLFLLSKKDQLSKNLLLKALEQGFDQELTEEMIIEFTDKGWVNDASYMEKQALKKIKKGYALTHLKGVQDLELAKNLELAALTKLIDKKKNLLLSDNIKEKQKGYRFFLSRGYSITQVKEQLAILEPNL